MLPLSFYLRQCFSVRSRCHSSLLSDNQTLMLVMRTDGDGHGYGCPAAGGRQPWHFYYQAYSRDFGKTWSEPRPIPGAGSVRPRLVLLDRRW
eukprot:SAG22_NODE_2152_length_2924_cov_1.454867_4_plen_92_part_00